MLSLLHVYQFDKKVRYGAMTDGGYVVGDIGGGYDCYISAGVGNEESFSRDFIREQNMTKDNSFAFDGTILSYPYEYTEQITFFRKNIGNHETNKTTNLSNYTNTYNNIFLKMDIEGGEYEWLSGITLEQLSKFKQIVIEFHYMNTADKSWGLYQNHKKDCLQKLATTHYLIHAHGNNCGGPVINGVPNVIELTYIRKNTVANVPQRNTTRFPIPGLDFPNDLNTPDINLSYPPFQQ